MVLGIVISALVAVVVSFGLYFILIDKDECKNSRRVVTLYNKMLDLKKRNDAIIILIGAAKINGDSEYVKELRKEYNENINKINEGNTEIRKLVKEEE